MRRFTGQDGVTLAALAAAAAFWFLLFSPWAVRGLGFWSAMPIGVLVLVLGAFMMAGRGFAFRLHFRAQHIWLGLASAAALYGLFAAGEALATRMFDFAGGEIADVYARRAGMSRLRIALLLFFVIGPGEELFWRGFVQHRFAERWGTMGGWLAGALVYAAVHIWALNLMLVLAAGLCALVWGALYARTRSLWPGIISHAVWDVAIFVLLPLGGG